MLISLVLGSLAAYSLARYRLRFGLERHIGVGLLTLRILPPIVIIVPAFLIVERLHLLNTWIGLIVIYSAFNVSFVVWMMESFFREIPVDLEEAAMVDGDSRFTAFRRIVLPLAAPGPRRHGDLRRDRDLQRVPVRARADLDAELPRRCPSARRR